MEKLGIEPNLLLAQIVNFVIIILVLTKLLYKPILNLLEKRKKEIEAGLALTEKMRLEDEKLKAKKSKVLEEARQEAQTIVEAARRQAEEQEKEIIARGQDKAQEIITKAKEEISVLHKELAGDLRREAVGLAGTMVKHLLAELLGERDQHRLIDKKLRQLEHAKFS